MWPQVAKDPKSLALLEPGPFGERGTPCFAQDRRSTEALGLACSVAVDVTEMRLLAPGE